MINGMEDFVGLKLKEEAVESFFKDEKSGRNYLITRPDFYSDTMHINMYVYFDNERLITDFDGNKCYSVNHGMYSRHARIHDREFTKRDIAFLKKYVKERIE